MNKPKPVILDPRDAIVRVTVNVETFCGECFFCQHGFVNNCTDPNGRWALGCRIDGGQVEFVREHYPDVLVCQPENCKAFTLANSDHGGADVVLEVAGAKDTFRLAWDCARPNASSPWLPSATNPRPCRSRICTEKMTFKTGGVDGCNCAEILSLIEAGKIDTTPLIPHRFKLEDIEEAYRIFGNKMDGVIKVAVSPYAKH